MWKDIPNLEGRYQANKKGQIRSVIFKNLRILKQSINEKRGYCYVAIHKDGKQTTKSVHRLIALTFLGPNSELDVNHIDGDRTNNNLNNLEYCTRSENMDNALQRGTIGKLSIEDTIKIYHRVHAGERGADLGREYGVSRHLISKIKTKKVRVKYLKDL